jgi:2-methylcitrate dehydratase PrpD
MAVDARKLSAFAAGISYEGLPVAVVDKTKDCVRDYLGCVLGAYPIDESSAVAEWVRDLGDREECTVLGWGYRTSSRNAALANGYLAEVLEVQDGSHAGGNHPASVIMSTGMAVAEKLGTSGREFIAAVVAGYEVANRVGSVLPPPTGFVKTSIAGTFGAAACAGRLLNLDAGQILNAFGIAGFILPISCRENMMGYTVKPFVGGYAAKAGIEAASLAQKGFTGCEEIFAGTEPRLLGLCNLLNQDPPLEKLIAGLNETYTILDVYFKPYAACRLAHAALEAALDLIHEQHVVPRAIERIEVKTFARAVEEIGMRYPRADSNFITCQFSLPYMVAAAVCDGTIGPQQYRREKLSDPDILALAERVKVSADPELTAKYPAMSPARVKLILRNSAAVEKQIDIPRWEPRRGVPEPELRQKFRELAAEVLHHQRITKLEEIVDELDYVNDIRDLIAASISLP